MVCAVDCIQDNEHINRFHLAATVNVKWDLIIVKERHWSGNGHHHSDIEVLKNGSSIISTKSVFSSLTLDPFCGFLDQKGDATEPELDGNSHDAIPLTDKYYYWLISDQNKSA